MQVFDEAFTKYIFDSRLPMRLKVALLNDLKVVFNNQEVNLFEKLPIDRIIINKQYKINRICHNYFMSFCHKVNKMEVAVTVT